MAAGEITPGTLVHVPSVDQIWEASSPEKATAIVAALAEEGYDAVILEPPYPERVAR